MNPDELLPPEYKTSDKNTRDSAANIIRKKLDALYETEPDAKEEVTEVKNLRNSHLSKHQRYMKSLAESGKDMAEIQTAWHEYYQSLPEVEKHEVWQEFYQEQTKLRKQKEHEKAETKQSDDQQDEIVPGKTTPPAHAKKRRSSSQPRTKTEKYISASSTHLKQIRKNHHVRSLTFGLGMGFLVVFILLFSFFNERFLTPFIRPNQNVSATPIIVDPNSSGPVGPESKIIIPKINVEAPVIYDVKTIEEKDVQAGLERGVVHYATTPNPGETGNAVIFGHSSGNILNKGKYKFAFLLLKSLEKDDTFIIQKDGKRYVYKIYNEFVTSPTDLSVLDPTDRPSTVTLITCDPPGTSTHRLIIQAEQIFPDPASNKKSSAREGNVAQPEQLPSNSPSLWQRLFGR